MTSDEIDKLEAGVELDMAVHKACHIPVVWDDKPRGILSFQPSSNWSHTMEAAEKAKLFRGFKYDLSQDKYGEWWIHKCDDHDSPLVMMAPTGPVAICRAILKAHASSANRE